MQDSVTLSDLPYTGFDYGEVYNSLFWVVLLVWSFIIARFIIKHGGKRLGKASVKRKQKKEVLRRQELKREPVVLEERVIRYQDPGMPIGSQQQAQVSNRQPSTQVVEPVAPAQVVASIEPEPAVVEQVSSIVEEELAVSRVGQSPDEFSAEDFATTDFDGVNPDVYWQPREIPKEVKPARQQQSEPKVATQEPVQRAESEPVSMPQEQPKVEEMEIKEQKQYKDTMTLNKSGEYPHMVIIREEVAS